MKLWILTQEQNRGYDTFDAAIVAAETAEEAARVEVGDVWAWTTPEYVGVTYLGEARSGQSAGLILGSFNAG